MPTVQLSDRLPVRHLRPICLEPGCTKVAKCRGMCWNCYQAWWRINRTHSPDIVIPEIGSLTEARREARQMSQHHYAKTSKFRVTQNRYLKSHKGKATVKRKRQRESSRRRILSFLNRACPAAISQVLPLTLEQAQVVAHQRDEITWELLYRLFPQSVVTQLRNLPFTREDARVARRVDLDLKR